MSENDLKKTAGKAKAEQDEPVAQETKQAGKEAGPTVQKAEQGAPETEALVYIGPDIPGAKQYTTFNGGLPDALREKIEEHPFFNSLVVPVGKLAKTGAELAREGSALNILYRRACEK